MLQNQLSDEKSLSEVLTKSLEDYKQRMKVTQGENVELKTQIDEANYKIDGLCFIIIIILFLLLFLCFILVSIIK